MSQDKNQATAFLEHVYPISQGWVLSECLSKDESLTHLIFENSNETIVAIFVDEPIVSKKSIKLAIETKAHYSKLFVCNAITIVMMFGELLVKPPRLPDGITAISLIKEDAPEPHLYSNAHTECFN